MTPGFWKGRKVLVTGHSGFKGAWMCLWLQRLGARVTGYSLPPPTQPSLFELAHISEGMASVFGDIRDLALLQSVCDAHQPEIVLHLAAQSLVRRSYAEPIETYTTNVIGTANVLETARRSGYIRAVVVVTSDKCYANREWMWGYREDEPMGGHDPYSSSKGCAELVTAAYRESFFSVREPRRSQVVVASARAGNVIGGGDWAEDRLIPDMIKAVMDRRRAFIRNPRAVRPWQHVLEPLHGYLMLAERLCEQHAAFASAWNFGPHDDDARPVSWIVERVASLWGDGAAWELDQAQHPHEAAYLKLDSSKARTLLGWRPTLDLGTALQWVVDWYKAYAGDDQMREFSGRQISRFEEMAAA